MLSHRQYSHALRSKERSGTREAQCLKRVKLIKNLPVLLGLNDSKISMLLASNMNVSTSSRISCSVRPAQPCDDALISKSRKFTCRFPPVMGGFEFLSEIILSCRGTLSRVTYQWISLPSPINLKSTKY
jgi:hypothetical protein